MTWRTRAWRDRAPSTIFAPMPALARRSRAALLAALLALVAAGFAATPAGARDYDVRASIFGGSVDRQPDVGWIAALMRHPSAAPGQDQYERQFCAGSLVAPDWVLTAAHCVTDNGVPEPPESLQILVGQKNLRGSGGEVRDITQVNIHPSYDDSTSRWDAALLHLASSVSVPPVPLARLISSHRNLYRSGRTSYIAGWGDRRAANDPRQLFPEALYSAFIPVRANSVCRRDWGSRFSSTAMFCAGNDRGRPDTCQGDSGGPIGIRRGSGASIRWILIGVTSFGRCGVRGNIGVYTRVRSRGIADWIDGTIP
jgi:secreted trypsin-like serine protease